MEYSLSEYEKSAGLYPWYAFFVNAYFWGPIFFLFFSSKCGIENALLLEAVYYTGVVLLEVPSGYFSDKIGRKITLTIASLFFCLSYFTFFIADSIVALAIGQLFLSGAFAFLSGTDTSLHYEILEKIGKENEYLDREAKISGRSFLAGAGAAILGGSIALISFNYAYLLSFLSALAGLIIILKIKEPPVNKKENNKLNFFSQLITLAKKSKSNPLKYTLVFTICLTVLNHLPYEFYQPYIKSLNLSDSFEGTTLFTGIHMALTMLLGAFISKYISGLKKKMGVKPLLVSTNIIITFMILMMTFFVHPLIAIILMLRNVPRAIAIPVTNSVVAPELNKNERGTYFSLQSMAGRLSFALTLTLISILSKFGGGGLQTSLYVSLVICVIAVITLLLVKYRD